MGAATSTLQDIMTKVRRITRSPSVNQLSDNDLTQYINTSVLYDLPQHLRERTLKTVVTWYTYAYVDTYRTDILLPTSNPLYDFENRYVTIDTPCYISGVRSFYTQSRDVFFGAFPQNQFIENFAVGDGTVTAFAGSFNQVPVLQNSVIFSSIDASNETYSYIDDPVTIQAGVLQNSSTGIVVGSVNYVTGAYNITFESAPAPSANVVRQSLPYTPSPPTSVLYHNLARIDADTGIKYNDKVFTVRPVPDGAYAISIEAYRNPVELLSTIDQPDLNQWWQYIAYLAAKKVFDDRLDLESIQMIMPELQEQQSLCLRKTIVQATTQRAATIYSPQLDNNPYFGTWGNQWQGPIG